MLNKKFNEMILKQLNNVNVVSKETNKKNKTYYMHVCNMNDDIVSIMIFKSKLKIDKIKEQLSKIFLRDVFVVEYNDNMQQQIDECIACCELNDKSFSKNVIIYS